MRVWILKSSWPARGKLVVGMILGGGGLHPLPADLCCRLATLNSSNLYGADLHFKLKLVNIR